MTNGGIPFREYSGADQTRRSNSSQGPTAVRLAISG
jgi:hypothetical protein